MKFGWVREKETEKGMRMKLGWVRESETEKKNVNKTWLGQERGNGKSNWNSTNEKAIGTQYGRVRKREMEK